MSISRLTWKLIKGLDVKRLTGYCMVGYFPQVQIFLNSKFLTLVEIFPIYKFMSPTTRKPHVSDISYKGYIGKTIICRTLIMSTISTCICTGVSKNSGLSAVYEHRETSLVWLYPFLVHDIYCLQYKHPAKPLSMVIMLCMQLSICTGRPSPQLHVAYIMFSQLLLLP